MEGKARANSGAVERDEGGGEKERPVRLCDRERFAFPVRERDPLPSPAPAVWLGRLLGGDREVFRPFGQMGFADSVVGIERLRQQRDDDGWLHGAPPGSFTALLSAHCAHQAFCGFHFDTATIAISANKKPGTIS